METEIIKQYINVERMIGCVLDTLKDSLADITDDGNRDYISQRYDDEYLEQCALELAWTFNDDMGRYLNGGHRIDGNFNNIDYDYPAFRDGYIHYDRPMVEDLVKRLNDGDMSEQSVKDRDWLVDWFFDTFGSFGIGYNFRESVLEDLYWHEEAEKHEKEEAYA